MNSAATPLHLTAARAWVLPQMAAPCAERLYDQVFDDILDRQFTHGLSEDALMRTYGASRSHVRRVVTRLARQQVILTRPNQRARVAEPDAEQIRQTLQARYLAETQVIQLLSARGDAFSIAPLRALVEQERQHLADGQYSTATRLGGEFHLQLARMAGNTPLVHFLGGLVPLTGLALAQQALPLNGWREREAIIDALERRDARSGNAHLTDYLDRLSAGLPATRV